MRGQHGVSRGRSTVMNLAVFEEFILSNFTKGLQVDSVYQTLVMLMIGLVTVWWLNLSHLELRNPFYHGLRYTLRTEHQLLLIAGKLSDPFIVMSSTPQGSFLGSYVQPFLEKHR